MSDYFSLMGLYDKSEDMEFIFHYAFELFSKKLFCCSLLGIKSMFAIWPMLSRTCVNWLRQNLCSLSVYIS